MFPIKKFCVAMLFFCLGFAGLLAQKADTGKSGQESFRVLVFLGTDCPISQDYVGVLNQIQERFGSTIKIEGIIPAKVNKRQVRAFSDEYQARFTIEPDPELALAKKYNISVTPEVILADEKGRVLYRGAIDNWFYALGQHRQITTENYLIDAITSLLAGHEVVVKETEPIGCPLTIPHH